MGIGDPAPLGMEVGLGSGDFVLDGHPAPPSKNGTEPPILGPCRLWPNGCMDQDATLYGGWPRPGHIVLDGDPAHPPQKGAQSPNFRLMYFVLKAAGWVKMAPGM